MSELTSLTLTQARDLLRQREFSAIELTKAHVAAIREARALNAFVLETPEQAHEMAARADAALAKGEGGPLAGVPLGVKDMFATKGVRTTACSHMLDTFVPTYESTVTANLWRDGAVMLGKLNNDEFAMGSSNETSYFGPVVSPCRRKGSDVKLVPGGSSGGSSAAVTRSVRGMKIGIPKEYRVKGMPDEIEALWRQGADWLKAAGAEVVEVSLPHTKYALATYYIVAPAEASSNLARYDGVRYGLRVGGRDIVDMYEETRAAGFGKEVRRRILIGTYVLSAGYYDAYYLRAQKVRTLIKRDFEDCFARGVNAVLTPTTPSAAFAIGEKSADPIEMYLNDVFTVTVNMAGLPGISVPAGLDSQGLPLGLQLIGRPFDEETLFSLGAVIEAAAGRFAPEKWW